MFNNIEKLYPKLRSVFHPISRYLKVDLKKLGCPLFFKPLLGVLIWDETLRVVLDILHETPVIFVTVLITGMSVKVFNAC